MEMETDENVVSQHGDTDLDDLIQYEEVEYDYDDTEDEDNQMDQNTRWKRNIWTMRKRRKPRQLLSPK